MSKNAFVLIVAALFCVAAPQGAMAAQPRFYSGYIGAIPAAPEDRAKTYFDRPEVRRLLRALETSPLPEAQVARTLSSTNTSLTDLLRLRLVRDDQGMLRIGFPYFTASDVNAIHAVAAKYVPSLIAAYQAKQTRLDAILARYPVASVNRKRLAFVLLAGFSLNWNALDLLTEKNYRQPLLIKGPDWQYGFWASEDVPGYSYKGYYWGSSSFPADAANLDPPLDFTFSSFGDPESDPRMNLPDLLALPADQMTPPVRMTAQALGLHDDDTLGMSLMNVIGLGRARSLGAMLFAMRGGAQTKAQICAAIPPGSASECDGALALLVATGYVQAKDADSYVLLVPVFDQADQKMLNSALALSRSVITDWLTQNYTPMRRELVGLTAVRQGIPYPALFSQIWHELFGLATHELAANGTIADPRTPDATWNGSIPVAWRASLYHHKWQ